MDENIEGPVLKEGQVPTGTRVHIDVPAKTVVIASGTVFVYSGYFLYHTLKALYKINKEA